MKKLLILAAVLVAGVAANAATFKWSAANIYDASGTTKYSGTAEIYAYLSDATIADSVLATTATVTSGAFNLTENWTAAEGGKTYNFYFVIEDNGKTFSSAESTPSVIKAGQAQATATTNIAFANMTSATQNASSWASVPEPTSGLLMLLGMAGLALRRRRA